MHGAWFIHFSDLFSQSTSRIVVSLVDFKSTNDVHSFLVGAWVYFSQNRNFKPKNTMHVLPQVVTRGWKYRKQMMKLLILCCCCSCCCSVYLCSTKNARAKYDYYIADHHFDAEAKRRRGAQRDRAVEFVTDRQKGLTTEQLLTCIIVLFPLLVLFWFSAWSGCPRVSLYAPGWQTGP